MNNNSFLIKPISSISIDVNDFDNNYYWAGIDLERDKNRYCIKSNDYYGSERSMYYINDQYFYESYILANEEDYITFSKTIENRLRGQLVVIEEGNVIFSEYSDFGNIVFNYKPHCNISIKSEINTEMNEDVIFINYM